MRLSIIIPVLASMLMVSACGDQTEDNQVTETRMDDLDSLEGTISDDMINTDQLTDEAPMEGAPAGTEPSDASAADGETAKTVQSEKATAGTTTTDASSETK